LFCPVSLLRNAHGAAAEYSSSQFLWDSSNCVDDQIKTHVDQFKLRESKKKDKRTKKEKQEQKIVDLLTVKAALSVLRESCWYWGNISGERAREVLRDTLPGTFLIRDSADKRYLFSLSVMTVRGPTSIRLIFSRGCFRIETSGIISPRSPCVVSLLVRMAYLARNSAQQPITEQAESVPDPLSTNQNGAPKSHGPIRKAALLQTPLFCKVPSLKHISRVAVNKFNLRNLTSDSLCEYIHQYPYPM